MKKLKNKDIKDYNKYKLLQVIKQEGAVTIEECCSKVKLSRPTVSRIIQELRYEDIIAPTGCVGDTGGRSAKLFGINDQVLFSIGLVVHLPKIYTVVLGLQKNIFYQNVFLLKEPVTVDAFIASLVEEIQKASDSLAQNAKKLIGIAIGIPGYINSPDGILVDLEKIPGCQNIPIAEIIQIHFHVPVILKNDSVIISKVHLSDYLQSANNILFTISDDFGIGSTLYHLGKVVDGKRGDCANLGHISLNPLGDLCFCGLRGCLDTVASFPGMVNQYNKKSTLPPVKSFSELLSLVSSGNKEAVQVIINAGYSIGFVIANIVKMCDINLIVLCFPSSYDMSFLVQNIKIGYQENILPSVKDTADFIVDKIDEYEFPLGAAQSILDSFIYHDSLEDLIE